MLYKLKLGPVETTIPTIGFNVEQVDFKATSFTCWDVGGRQKIRALWRHYWQGTKALIFVVDSNDRERVEEARHELQVMMGEEELKDMVLLVFANKQDLPHVMTTSELTEKLGLHTLGNRRWHIQASCATSGDGLQEGLEWLSRAIAGDEIAAPSHDGTSGSEEGQKAETAGIWGRSMERLQALGSSSLMNSKFWLSLL
eukprot:CAMPEP_0113821660 /NCGR_PEP_ID=MMETSP0328-20130328/1851_1 /TAXON_ID=39455 /ORGANISM="Alexandrium minutum" /LENGTH=198 /DNA_ID=CAMNT_0000789595 /DNA_START=178 /DNA_END=774 /DNA_ORIENTATION=- /assembly_acc=CAM_ASM_000350